MLKGSQPHLIRISALKKRALGSKTMIPLEAETDGTFHARGVSELLSLSLQYEYLTGPAKSNRR